MASALQRVPAPLPWMWGTERSLKLPLAQIPNTRALCLHTTNILARRLLTHFFLNNSYLHVLSTVPNAIKI